MSQHLIREWREHHRLSLREAATVFGFADGSTVLNLERGRHVPTPETMLRIYFVTKALGPRPVDCVVLIEAWAAHHPEKIKAAKAWIHEARRRLNKAKELKNGTKAGRKTKG